MERINLNHSWDRPLRDRAREALIYRWRLAHPRDLETVRSKGLAAEQIRKNAEAYKARHCAHHTEEEWAWMRAHRPVMGPGLSPAEVYLCLSDQVDKALAKTTGEPPEPTADEIDSACRGWWPTPSATRPSAPADGLGIPEGLTFAGETRKGYPLFTDAAGRLLVRDSKGSLIGYSGDRCPYVDFA